MLGSPIFFFFNSVFHVATDYERESRKIVASFYK